MATVAVTSAAVAGLLVQQLTRRQQVELESVTNTNRLTTCCRVNGREQRLPVHGVGLHSVVLNGSAVSPPQYHGLLEQHSIEKILRSVWDAVEAAEGNHLILYAVGSTHEKKALNDVRAAVVSSRRSFTKQFFQRYEMPVLLSPDHGCCQGYICMIGVRARKVMEEHTGQCGGICFPSMKI